MNKYKIRNYEAYFDHGCTIVRDKDVLDLDIKDKTFLSAMTKWWNDLFLLSYFDQRSRQCFLSLNSMSVERARQFRLYKKAIHPFSKFKKFWDYFITSFFVLDLLLFHYRSSVIFIDISKPALFYYFVSLCEVFPFIDIFINSRTGYVDNKSKTVVLDSNKILIHYFSTKLFLHSASAIPLESLMLMRYGPNVSCGHCKSNKFMITLRFASSSGVFRMFDMSRNWEKGSSSSSMYIFKFLRIIILSLISMFHVINMFDSLSMLYVINYGVVTNNSALHYMLEAKYNMEMTNYELFCLYFSRICRSLLFVGNVTIAVYDYSIDKLCSLISFAVTMIFYTWAFVECFAYMSKMNYAKDQLSIAKYTTLNKLRCHQLPDAITAKVASYFDFNMTQVIVTQKLNGLYSGLPDSILSDIKINCYSKYIRRMPFFSSWPTERTDEIVLMLKEEVHLQNDIVSNIWTQGDGLILISSGVMAVYSADSKEMGHLIDGDYFGEQSLVTDKEIGVSYVVAVTNCMILILDKFEFRRHMRSYPELFFEMKRYLKEEEDKVEKSDQNT